MKANLHYECISTFLQGRSPFANENEDLIPTKTTDYRSQVHKFATEPFFPL